MNVKLLKVLKNLIEVTGIDIRDIKNINIICEYYDMINAGDKKTYIYAVLADRYGISEKSIRRIVSRLECGQNVSVCLEQ